MPTRAELVTPERILFSGEAEFVVLRSDGGEIMFLPNHAPYIGAVDISLVRIAPPGADASEGAPAHAEEFRAAVHGGFVHVVNNQVTLLASVAEPADEIDLDRARRALEAAEAALASSEETADRRENVGGAGRAGTGVVPEGEEAEEQAELSSTMRALLFPDDAEVAARRARVRLEAAGEGELTTAASPAH